jgi:hypothetical protein
MADEECDCFCGTKYDPVAQCVVECPRCSPFGDEPDPKPCTVSVFACFLGLMIVLSTALLLTYQYYLHG